MRVSDPWGPSRHFGRPQTGANLIGMALRETVGARALKEGKVELKVRKSGLEFK